MFFTREDINKIYQALLKLGIKDSELPETSDVKNDDTLAIVQDGENKQINVREFLNQISLWKREDFINVTDKYKKSHITLVEAIQAIPIVQRKEGLVITFLDNENNWRIYQFRGSLLQFNNETLWVDLYDFSPYIIDSILPDEEDITQSAINEQGNTYLSLKDREYNPDEFSGKGYKILRKNIIEIEDANSNKVKKNILTEEMINEPNTVYEIRYDFDLNGKSIQIGNDCVLTFKGGSFKNGKIIGENTVIDSLPVLIFNNIDLSGRYICNTSYPEWFGAKANDKSINNATYINNCLKTFNKCCLVNGIYYVTGSDANESIIKMPKGSILTSIKKPLGSNVNDLSDKVGIATFPDTVCNFVVESTLSSNLFNLYIIANTTISGIHIIESYVNIDSVTIVSANIGIQTNSSLLNIRNTSVAYCNTGFLLLGNYQNGIAVTENTSILLEKCYALLCRDAGYHMEYIIYSSLICCACDNIGTFNFNKETFKAAYYLEHCTNVSLINCGSEYNIKMAYFSYCKLPQVSIRFYANYETIVSKDPDYFKKYVYIQFSNGNINFMGEFTNKPTDKDAFIFIYDYERELLLTLENINEKNITLSTSGELTDVLNKMKNNIILKESTNSLRSSLICKGTDKQRPDNSIISIGFQYYDTTLKKYIVWNGTEWTNMDGTTL